MSKEKNKTIMLCGVLIVAIIVVAVSLFAYKMKKDNEEKVSLEDEIGIFEGDAINGSDVKFIIASILNRDISMKEKQVIEIDYDVKKLEENNEKIAENIELTGNQDSYVQKIINFRNEIDKKGTYKVEYQKENDKIIKVKVTQ